jgi:type I site-specific restriction endonuclease
MSNIIHTLDSVWTQVDHGIAKLIQNELTYQDSYWRKKPNGRKEKVVFDVNMLETHSDGEHYFHTGFVPRITGFCNQNEIEYTYRSDLPEVEYDEPHIEGITFRDYQLEFIEQALSLGRGVFKSATGTGKSVMIAGLISAFSEETILFLVHTQDLISQMYEDLETWNLGPIGEWTGKKKEHGRIMLATIQTFAKYAWDFTDTFDVVFVDECFHKNTKISIPNGRKKIIDIKRGDTVKVSNGEEKKVTQTFKNKVPLSNLCKVKLSNGKTIICSKDHVFKTKNGEVAAKDLSKEIKLNVDTSL